MTEPGPVFEPDPGAVSADVVDLLRSLASTVHAGEVDDGARAEALAHLQAARRLLDGGEPRLRWYEVDGADKRETRARNRELSTFSGVLNVLAPPLRIRTGRLADGRPALIGRVRLDRLREGPPRAVHGGVLAGLFDELLGGAQGLEGGPPGVTARLTVKYRRPTPLEADLEFRVWIHDERTRRVVLRGDCRVVEQSSGVDDPGPVTAEVEAVFLRVDFAGMEDAMRTRSPGEATKPAPRLEER